MELRKVGDISHEKFMKEFFEPGTPVVFKMASRVWKANGLFTPDYFRKNFGNRSTKVDDREFTMSESLDLIEKSTPENPAPYPCRYDVPSQLPEILPLISPLGMNYAVPNWFESRAFPRVIYGSSIELFLGGPGGKFPVTHIDFFHTNAWITQLYGKKNFVLFPAGQEKFLYPKKDNPLTSVVNIFKPDFERHPKFRSATPFVITLEQGETIFIPWGIWHCSESLSPSISVIFDQLNKQNFNAWARDVWEIKKKESNKLRAWASMVYYSLAANLFCRLGDALGVKRGIK